MDELMTVAEVAAKLKVHPKSIYRFVYAGQLEAVRIGNRNLRFTEEQVAEFLDRKKVCADPE